MTSAWCCSPHRAAPGAARPRPVRPHAAAVGLQDVPAYGIADVNCAALFRAVELAEGWLGHFPRRAVLALAGDLASFIPEARRFPGPRPWVTPRSPSCCAARMCPTACGGGPGARTPAFPGHAHERRGGDGLQWCLRRAAGEVIDDALAGPGGRRRRRLHPAEQRQRADVDVFAPSATSLRADLHGPDPAIGHTITTDAFQPRDGGAVGSHPPRDRRLLSGWGLQLVRGDGRRGHRRGGAVMTAAPARAPPGDAAAAVRNAGYADGPVGAALAELARCVADSALVCSPDRVATSWVRRSSSRSTTLSWTSAGIVATTSI